VLILLLISPWKSIVLHHLDVSGTDYLLFYINSPSVIIGRHQHTRAEINPSYIHANRVRVIRRLSGGGAVYHDFRQFEFLALLPRFGGMILVLSLILWD
jgi:lipoate-protein ligase A